MASTGSIFEAMIAGINPETIPTIIEILTPMNTFFQDKNISKPAKEEANSIIIYTKSKPRRPPRIQRIIRLFNSNLF